MTDKQGRYKTSGMVEDQYMSGSDGLVLKNLLDITTKEEIDRVETETMMDFEQEVLRGVHRKIKVFKTVIEQSLKAYEEAASF